VPRVQRRCRRDGTAAGIWRSGRRPCGLEGNVHDFGVCLHLKLFGEEGPRVRGRAEDDLGVDAYPHAREGGRWLGCNGEPGWGAIVQLVDQADELRSQPIRVLDCLVIRLSGPSVRRMPHPPDGTVTALSFSRRASATRAARSALAAFANQRAASFASLRTPCPSR